MVGANDAVKRPLLAGSSRRRGPMLEQSSPSARRSRRKRKLTKARSLVSGPPRAGSNNCCGYWKALSASSETSRTTASRISPVIVVGLGSAVEIGGPKYVAWRSTAAVGSAAVPARRVRMPSTQARPGRTMTCTAPPMTSAESMRKPSGSCAGTAHTPAPMMSRPAWPFQPSSSSSPSVRSASVVTRPCWCNTPLTLRNRPSAAGSTPRSCSCGSNLKTEKSPCMAVPCR